LGNQVSTDQVDHQAQQDHLGHQEVLAQ
jgi:hypothetical protein